MVPPWFFGYMGDQERTGAGQDRASFARQVLGPNGTDGRRESDGTVRAPGHFYFYFSSFLDPRLGTTLRRL